MTQDTLEHLGQIIQKYRIAAGISQEHLSERMECDKNTIGRIERGESDCRFSTLVRLAEGMNVSLSRLMRDFEKNSTDQYSATVEYDFLRLFSYCRQLNPKQFNNLCNTALLYAEKNTTKDD